MEAITILVVVFFFFLQLNNLSEILPSEVKIYLEAETCKKYDLKI